MGGKGHHLTGGSHWAVGARCRAGRLPQSTWSLRGPSLLPRPGGLQEHTVQPQRGPWEDLHWVDPRIPSLHGVF